LFIPGSSHFPALEGFAEKRRGEAPFIICKLSSVLRRDDRPLLLRWRALRSKAKLLSKADAVVALSPALANEANQLLGPLPLSIIEDPIFAREDGRPPHATDPRNGLIAAGRLAPAKDFGLAVEALACSKDRGLTLTILGEGPDRAALERQVERAGLTGRVTLPGNVPDIKPWLQSGRAFILSSRYEGYPAVAVEALSQGTPVIATNCTPAMREIITNPARGEVVGTRRAHDLARAVDRVLLRPLPALTDTEELWHRHQIDGAADHYLQLFDS
jgi:glycosyltransferase involved in cell wall biosynthesis